MRKHFSLRKKQLNEQRRINTLMPFTTAPLFHALQLLVVGDSARFHMPGHKGQPVFESFAEMFAIDFTETHGTGNLYLGEGPIRDAEIAAARYFRADDCFFLTGGSTQGNLAMLATAIGQGGAVLLDRGCHKSVCHACALLDITPHFITAAPLPGDSILGGISPEAIESALRLHPEIRGMLVTSPTYYGVCHDLSELAAVCHRHGARLLVDGAHGAHFRALGIPMPIESGTDIAVLSIHKTLPCLGQGAVLLMKRDIDRKALRENTALFGTSSPSYPIMASIDLARAYMEDMGAAKYLKAAENCIAFRSFLNESTGFSALDEGTYELLDPCRLTVSTRGTSFTGMQVSSHLWEQFGIACEMDDPEHIVFIFSANDTAVNLRRLKNAFKKLSSLSQSRLPQKSHASIRFPDAERVMSVREAWFSPHRGVSLPHAVGKICARPVTPYPPGIPLLWPGEKITATHIELLQKRWYNIEEEIQIVDVSAFERGSAL